MDGDFRRATETGAPTAMRERVGESVHPTVSGRLNVHLTFDVEIWCGGWSDIDERFPRMFDRYVYGRSTFGQFALPKTLEILNAHGLKAVFFVEPLFAARFGVARLREVVELIQGAGQEVQLHLHPEWVDEVVPPLVPSSGKKRFSMAAFSQADQAALIRIGRQLLAEAGAKPVSVFRAGSFACSRDTYRALAEEGIYCDSSLNGAYDCSGIGIEDRELFYSDTQIDAVASFPVTLFRDGLGRLKPAQVAGCGLGELVQALDQACVQGRQSFVIVSHNFEMLHPDSTQPDWTVVDRFDALCAHLARHPERFAVCGFQDRQPAPSIPDRDQKHLNVSLWPTLRRVVEQAGRRWWPRQRPTLRPS